MRLPSKLYMSCWTSARTPPGRVESRAVSSTAGMTVPCGIVCEGLAKRPALTRSASLDCVAVTDVVDVRREPSKTTRGCAVAAGRSSVAGGMKLLAAGNEEVSSGIGAGGRAGRRRSTVGRGKRGLGRSIAAAGRGNDSGLGDAIRTLLGSFVTVTCRALAAAREDSIALTIE